MRGPDACDRNMIPKLRLSKACAGFAGTYFLQAKRSRVSGDICSVFSSAGNGGIGTICHLMDTQFKQRRGVLTLYAFPYRARVATRTALHVGDASGRSPTARPKVMGGPRSYARQNTSSCGLAPITAPGYAPTCWVCLAKIENALWLTYTVTYLQ